MPIVSTGQITITDVNDGVGLVILPTSLGFTYVDGVASPADQWIGFTVQRQGPVSGNAVWYASNGAELVTDAGQVSALSISLGLYGAEDGHTCFMHISQVTSDEPVTITAIVGEVSAVTQVARLHRSTAAANANNTYVDANGQIQGVSSGAGTGVNNAVAVGNILSSGGGLLPNWNLGLVDASDKPAGIQAVEGITDRTGIAFGDASRTWVKLSHATDTTIAYGFPAIPIDDRKVYVFRVRHKSTSASPPATGLYYYFIEKAGALASGKTHVMRSTGDATVGDLETSTKYVYFNGAYPSNSGWVETADLVYVPTAGTRFASFAAANWNNATTVELHIDAVYLSELSSTTYRQAAQPTGGIYVKGDMWVDTDATGTPTYQYDGAAWQVMANNATNTNQLTDGANLGGTATWGGVSGTGKPLDNAGHVLDTRNVNGAPNTYAVGNHREFKFCSVVGITTTATYCVVETIKGWGDSSGGEAVQWAYVTSGEVWKRSAGASATTWGAWVRDLDRSLYTGDLAATKNAVSQGTLAARPTGTDGDFYYATDNGNLYQKISGAWVVSSTNTFVDANGNLQGVSSGAGANVANNQDSIIRNPVGGVFTTSAGTLTGRLKVKLPQLWSSTMVRFTVEIFEYAAGFSCTLEVGGYNYNHGSGNGSWINCTARVIGGSNVEYPVRFGRDADKCCVWIGNATDTWEYPQVRVRDVFLGYSNYTAAQWSTGWAISFDTTALTSGTGANQFNVEVLDTLPGADWAKISGSNKPANGATRNVFRGAWVNGTSYIPGDNVTHQGYGWSNILATSSVAPPTYPTTSNANWVISAVKGDSSITALLTNESHTVPASSTGVVSSYVGSGTGLNVFDGATQLAASATATTSAFRITGATVSPSGKLTVGTVTYSGNTATVPDHSVMDDLTDTVTVTYAITVYRADGTSSNITKAQTITKSKAGATGGPGLTGPQGPSVVVTSDRPATFNSEDGTLVTSPTQADIVFTATPSGITSPTYAWSFSGLQANPTAVTGQTVTVTPTQFGTSKSALVTCTVSPGGYKDTMTIVRLEKSTAAAGATVGADSSNLKTGSGVNMLINGHFRDGLIGCIAGYRSGGNQHTLYHNYGANYQLLGSDGLAGISQPGSASAGTVFDAGLFGSGDNRKISVRPGQRYEVYGWLNTHRCTGVVGIAFYNSTGAYISETAGNVLPAIGGVVTNLSHLQRSSVFAVAPAGAVDAIMYVRGIRNGTENDAWVFFARCYFGEAGAAQTEPSLWNPGSGLAQITTGNASTYIANLAVGELQIANASVSRIASHTVALPTSAGSFNVFTIGEVKPGYVVHLILSFRIRYSVNDSLWSWFRVSGEDFGPDVGTVSQIQLFSPRSVNQTEVSVNGAISTTTATVRLNVTQEKANAAVIIYLTARGTYTVSEFVDIVSLVIKK